MSKKINIVELKDIVIKFAGDSGDGMQMTGSQFTDFAASLGADLSTLPDYPAEIRAPQGTVSGVSGFQIHVGTENIQTPGDKADVLIAMNPAALKSNLRWIKRGAVIIIDNDMFDKQKYEKAGFTKDPLTDESLHLEYNYQLIKVPITSQTKNTLKDFNLDTKTIERTKNQFISGILCWLFNRELAEIETFLKDKYSDTPLLLDANLKVLEAGFHYAETIEVSTTTFNISPSHNKKGIYRNITGNTAIAWGLIAASDKSGRPLFISSYPITPASDICQELLKRKSLGVKTFQSEDEIAGICSALGASFAGSLAVTATSGPGLSLKSESIGLAVMTELPIVIIDVQRAGPATGMPTKIEQSDLMQALYGRSGECPCIVIAAISPGQCFESAYIASKLAMEHMTPVILLSDSLLANGSELWMIPDTSTLDEINPPLVKDDDSNYQPYARDNISLSRNWAIPGQKGLRHRIGGLEKTDITGEVSYEAYNHEKMIKFRDEKVQRVARYIPNLDIHGKESGDLLVVGWGGTYGTLLTAVTVLQNQGFQISLAQFEYINPLPLNTKKAFGNFKRIIVCELNLGQFAGYLRSKLPQYKYSQYNKIQGLPFLVSELVNIFQQNIKEINE